MASEISARQPRFLKIALRIFLIVATLLVAGVLVWQGVTAHGNPNPTAPHTSPGIVIIDVGVLVFREGLECILVLSAITASMIGKNQSYRRPIAAGAGVGFIAVMITWFVVVGIINDLSQNISALDVQAGTGLLAIVVLLVIMNWFFHKVYWTGWISIHNKKKRDLMKDANDPAGSMRRVLWGMALLGFSSFYREGFEVVLFLQSYRLRMGTTVVLEGVIIGGALTAAVAVLTFIAHHRLPYKKMLILTGGLLGAVLLVMVGEQALEMQQANWIPTTTIPWLTNIIPGWMGLWFSVFPTVQTLIAQFIAAIVVIGSYAVSRYQTKAKSRPTNTVAEAATTTPTHTTRTAPIEPSSVTKNVAMANASHKDQ